MLSEDKMSKRKNATPVTAAELLTKPLKLYDTDRLHVALKDNDTEEFSFVVKTEGSTWKDPSQAAKYDFFSRVPERKEISKDGTRWVCPATDITVQLIRELWPQEQVVFSEDAAVVYGYLAATIEQQKVAIERSAEYHDFVARRKLITFLAVPTPKFIQDFDFRGDLTAMLHQCVGIMNQSGTDGFGGFMEQGTGKTPMTIKRIERDALRIRERENRLLRVLVVAPKNVRQNWVSEFHRFATVPGNVVVARGNAIERIEIILKAIAGFNRPPEDRYAVVVCSYECLSQSWETIGQVPWDIAILDESHYIKWPLTKRAKYSHKLRDISKARIALTGTPICNTPVDLYSQLEFLRKGGSGFHTFKNFKKFYGVFATVNKQKRMIDVQNLPFMRERLARMAICVRKEEALPDLPKIAYDIVEVEMTPEQKKAYTALDTQLYYEIKNDLDDSTKSVNANNILTKMLRLAQITSGFISTSPVVDLDTGEELQPRSIDDFEPNVKLDALIELLKGTGDPTAEDSEDEIIEGRPPDEKTIIWAHWIHDIEAISKRLTVEGINHVVYQGSTSDDDRAEAERRFNGDRDCPVLLGTAGAGGTGLNLIGYPPGRGDEYETDTTMVIYYSQDWSMPKRLQSQARGHRGGTRRPVRVVDFVVPGTIDEEIRARVVDKNRVAVSAQNLREVLSKVFGRSI
jgi:SNF2 family DNA or RNA helicase